MFTEGEYIRQFEERPLPPNFDGRSIRQLLWYLENMNDPLSAHKDFFELLPKVLDSHPLFWEQDELKFLDGTDLAIAVELRRKREKARYDSLVEAWPDFGLKHSLNDWLVTITLYESRNYSDSSAISGG